jgi:hypothetical protein
MKLTKEMKDKIIKASKNDSKEDVIEMVRPVPPYVKQYWKEQEGSNNAVGRRNRTQTTNIFSKKN